LHLGAKEAVLESGEVVPWDALVMTAPLSHLAAMTADLPAAGRAAAARLRAVAVVNLNLGVRGPAPRREHWLYVPEERFPFYRVGIPSNHGAVAPPGCHTLSVEVSLPAGAATASGLRERCLEGLMELGLLRDAADVVTVDEVHLDPAYVIFDAARPEAVSTLRDAYRAAGVALAGRWAEWKYSQWRTHCGTAHRGASAGGMSRLKVLHAITMLELGVRSATRWIPSQGSTATSSPWRSHVPMWASCSPRRAVSPMSSSSSFRHLRREVRPWADLRAYFELRKAIRWLLPRYRAHSLLEGGRPGPAGGTARRRAGSDPLGPRVRVWPAPEPACPAVFLAAERMAARRTDAFITVSVATSRTGRVSASSPRSGHA